jgi:hypothetical protein
MQRFRRRIGVVGGAVLASAALSVRADISGFSGFSPVNINAPSTNSIGISGSTFEVTDGQNSEAVSAWDSTAQNITSFTVSYSYQTLPQQSYASGASVQADGTTIAFQNPTSGSTTALGGNGGGLGYAGLPMNTAAIGFELFDGYYDYQGGSELLTAGSQGGVNDLSNGVDLSTGDRVTVRLSYAGNTLTQTVADLSIGAASTQTYTGVNLASILGSNSAIIGVTGGTGGLNSTQTISNFSFKSASATAIYSPLAVTGFNQKMIVPAGGSFSNVTATMDSGTADTGATFYEMGYPGSSTGTGLPASGSTFTSQNDAQHTFTMQSYAGNDALLLGASSPTGTLMLSNPEALSSVSVLMADGGGTEPFSVMVTFTNGTSELIDGAVSPDWFYNGTVAYTAGGRIYDDGSLENDGSNPNLYQVDLGLTDQTDLVSSLTFTYEGSSSSTSNTAIYAVSGVASAVPEPASIGLIGFAGLGLLRRRRKA